MSRWIDAEKELKELKDMKVKGEVFTTAVNFAIRVIEEAPSIDIVFCRECKLGGTEDCPMDEIDDEYYCNFGEREGE